MHFLLELWKVATHPKGALSLDRQTSYTQLSIQLKTLILADKILLLFYSMLVTQAFHTHSRTFRNAGFYLHPFLFMQQQQQRPKPAGERQCCCCCCRRLLPSPESRRRKPPGRKTLQERERERERERIGASMVVVASIG